MQRNIILYILIALLVVVGGTWYALSTRTDEGERREDRNQEEQDRDEEDDTEEDEDTGGESDPAEEADTDTGTGTSETEETSDTTQGSATLETEDSLSDENLITSNESFVGGVGGTEMTIVERERIQDELQAQAEILATVLTVIELQLEAGEITAEEANNLLNQVSSAAEELEQSIELYLAL